MEIFKLVEQVLDELYAQISGSETAKAAAVNGKLTMLTRRYTDLKREADPIDYSEPATRLAYLYKYVTCHSNLVYTRIKDLRELSDLFEKSSVQVACLRGGPGSDLLGMLKYCADYRKRVPA